MLKHPEAAASEPPQGGEPGAAASASAPAAAAPAGAIEVDPQPLGLGWHDFDAPWFLAGEGAAQRACLHVAHSARWMAIEPAVRRRMARGALGPITTNMRLGGHLTTVQSFPARLVYDQAPAHAGLLRAEVLEAGLADLAGRRGGRGRPAEDPEDALVAQAVPYHEDIEIAAVFTILACEDAGYDVVFPRLGARVALTEGAMLTFDCAEPHAMLPRGASRWRRPCPSEPIEVLLSIAVARRCSALAARAGWVPSRRVRPPSLRHWRACGWQVDERTGQMTRASG